MTRRQTENPRLLLTSLAIVIVTLHIAAVAGCVDLFGALPCNDDSNCPPSLVCVDSLCAEPIVCESDAECANGEVCGGDGACAQVRCEEDADCPEDGSVCADEGCVVEETGCAVTCATDFTCDEVFELCLAGDVFEGDFVVESLAALEELRAYRRVTGTVFIGIEGRDDNSPVDVEGLTDLNLELLVEAAGMWVWGQSSLLQLQMPALRVIGAEGFVVAQNAALTSISLPRLTGGPLSIFSLESLVEIHLDRFRTVDEGQDFHVITLPALELLSAPELVAADIVSLQYLGTQGGQPTELSLPKLATFATMSITDSPTLGDVSLPALTTVTSQLFVGSNFGMRMLSLPSLAVVEDKLTVERNPVLTTLDVTSLDRVGALTILFNDELCAEDLFDKVVVDGTSDVSSNGTCP